MQFAERSSEDALRELDRVWQGEASGSLRLCRSPFGVTHDGKCRRMDVLRGDPRRSFHSEGGLLGQWRPLSSLDARTR